MDYFDMLLARKLSGGGASSEAMISDEYDSTKTYAKGDYCIYNNTLYKCKTAISTPEEWNASHWDATIVTDELSQLKGVDDDIQEMIGDEYSSSSAYAVGDYCIYNNTLYKCTTAISTAEAWNPSHWTPTSCDTELSELKTDLVDLDTNTFTSITANTNRITAIDGGIVKRGKEIIVNYKFKAIVSTSNSPKIATIQTYVPKLDIALSCIDITNGIGSAIEASIPCGVKNDGVIYIKYIENDHIYTISGVYVTT